MQSKNVFSAENLKKGIEMMRKQKNQFGKPLAWRRSNVYIIECPHCKENLQYPCMMPKMICYKCNKIIDNLLKSEDIENYEK